MVVLQQPNILFYCQNNPIEGCASSYSHGKEAKQKKNMPCLRGEVWVCCGEVRVRRADLHHSDVIDDVIFIV